jgi:hypothetical protein
MARPTARDVQVNAQAMYLAGVHADQICEELSIKLNTFYSWVSRKKWVQGKRNRSARIQKAVAQSVKEAVTDQTSELRERLNGELSQQMDALESKPVKYGELFSRGQGRAAMVKNVVESFRGLNGGAESINVVFGVNVIHDAGDPSPIEVQAEVKASEPEG